jgi:uncharacterized protein YjbI with pentapeptide repeats
MLRADVRGAVNLCGPPGSGKSAALEHLAAILPADAPLTMHDCQQDQQLDPPPGELLVFTSNRPIESGILTSFEMAPWTLDDLIEYLIATHRGRCASVLARVGEQARAGALAGLPELWSIVLDVMAADDSIADVSAALTWQLGMELPRPDDYEEAARKCVQHLLFNLTTRPDEVLPPSRVSRLLRHRAVQIPLAAAGIARQLICDDSAQIDEAIARRFPRELLEQVSARAAGHPAADIRLRALADSWDIRLPATAASLLVMMHSDWRPSEKIVYHLGNAYLANARWHGVRLASAQLPSTDLTSADLEGANLERANLTAANLAGARLVGSNLYDAAFARATLRSADLRKVFAPRCKFLNADLEEADLHDACLLDSIFSQAILRKANLRGADLRAALLDRCELDEADLRGAKLAGAELNHLRLAQAQWDGADFHHAKFNDCDLENLAIARADFTNATFQRCLLTDSTMPSANFRGAKLRGAGLAGIDWPNADLRDCDLTHATFHLGSTRSGLVGSTIPCEGSKTGFYTDEFNEQDYKAPEEIRKANLRGADLRGANIVGTDFYLVDLREAKFSKSQREHLARCGAILSGRT